MLVDTGHHYQAQNIEQIVAWLLDLDMLGGFHFNDRRYADDDLTLGSIDPYQVFRIFHEIRIYEWETGQRADIAYMIDQSHNLKAKIEAMIQTVDRPGTFRQSRARRPREAGERAGRCALIDAESCLKDAFSTDVRPAIREWAGAKGLPEDPHGGVPRERLSGARNGGTRGAQPSRCFELRLRAPKSKWFQVTRFPALLAAGMHPH